MGRRSGTLWYTGAREYLLSKGWIPTQQSEGELWEDPENPSDYYDELSAVGLQLQEEYGFFTDESLTFLDPIQW